MRTKEMILKKTTIKHYEVSDWPILISLVFLTAVLVAAIIISRPYYGHGEEVRAFNPLLMTLNFFLLAAVLLLLYSLVYFPVRALFWRLVKKRLDRDNYKLVNKARIKYLSSERYLAPWVKDTGYNLKDLILVSYRNFYYLYCKFT